jgi:hypothetical protein
MALLAAAMLDGDETGEHAMAEQQEVEGDAVWSSSSRRLDTATWLPWLGDDCLPDCDPSSSWPLPPSSPPPPPPPPLGPRQFGWPGQDLVQSSVSLEGMTSPSPSRSVPSAASSV